MATFQAPRGLMMRAGWWMEQKTKNKKQKTNDHYPITMAKLQPSKKQTNTNCERDDEMTRKRKKEFRSTVIEWRNNGRMMLFILCIMCL